MSRTVQTRTRLMVALAALATMMFALVPAAPASAGTLTVVVEGTATLDAGISAPCTSNIHHGSFVGTANGTHGNAQVVNQRVTADFRYCNSTTVAGTAEGTITIAQHTCAFAWVRTGIIADIELGACVTASGAPHSPSSGSAVAEFVPTSLPGAIPGTAQVVGEGVLP